MKRVLAVAAAAAVHCAAAAGPLVAWSSTDALSHATPELGSVAGKAQLAALLPEAGTVHVFLASGASHLGNLLSTPAGAASVGDAVQAAASRYVAPQAAVSADDVNAALAARGCSVTFVGGEGAAAISREQYTEQLAQPAEGCAAFVVPFVPSAEELAWVAGSAKAAAAARSTFLLLSPSVGASEEAAVPAQQPAGAGAERPGRIARELAGSTTLAGTATRVYITMNPPILVGLLLGLLLIFFVLVGLSCVASIPTPDVMHSTTLPAGKEY